MIPEWVKSKKFAVVMLSILSLDALCYLERIDGSLFITGLLGVVVGYITGNVAQKAVENKP